MKCRTLLLLAILTLPAALAPRAAAAGSVELDGIADQDTTYYEEFADGFYRMDRRSPPPNEHIQRFYLISNPSVPPGSATFDGFPHDEDFRLGTVTYDDADLVGGSGVADITGVTLGIGMSPSDSSYLNFRRWEPNFTVVQSFSGTVSVSNGVATAINMTSQLVHHFFVLNNELITEPGTFTITGNRFDGYVQGYVPNDAQNRRFIWDFAGTLTEVASAPTLVGDYNNNQVVDAADYALWRKVSGTDYALPNRDSNASGNIGPADYTAWRTHFGSTPSAAGVGSQLSAVPEPATALLGILALVASAILQRR